MTTTSFSAESSEAILWSRDDISGDATFAFTNLYQSGAPQEAVKVTADAAFGALATWLSEQQRLVERAFEVRLHCCDRWLATLAAQPRNPQLSHRQTTQRSRHSPAPRVTDGALHAHAAVHRGAHAGADGAAHHPAG